VATRFRDRYCSIVSELVGLFDEIAVIDREINDLNDRGSLCNAPQRVRGVELTSRGLDTWGARTPIAKRIKLPAFGIGGDGTEIWPRPTVPIGLAMMAAMPSAAPDPELQAAFETGGNAGYVEALRRRESERADRLVEQGQQAERERERRNAEAADAERARRHA
jgi:hypothetical protein